MRWETQPKTPKSGEKRKVQYFAFFPTELDDGYTVWLENYWALESWDDDTTSTGVGYWKTIRTQRKDPTRPDTGSHDAK
jgi:hypothetical protein